jgi:hypothetical protein
LAPSQQKLGGYCDGGIGTNHYSLNGYGPLQVIYASSGFGGEPQLTYQDPRQTPQFSGNAIQQVGSDAGTLVSVTIAETTDTGSTTFSLLIPRVTLWNRQPAHIRTVGVTALHRLTTEGPVNGQLDSYHTHHLSGAASVVEL